jgi:hypothetical protein
MDQTSVTRIHQLFHRNGKIIKITKIENHFYRAISLLLYRLSNVLILYSTTYNTGDLKILTYIYENKDLLGKLKRRPHLIILIQEKNLEQIEEELELKVDFEGEEEEEIDEDLEEEKMMEKRLQKFKEIKIKQIEKKYFSTINFYKIPTFKKKKGKFDEKKDSFDKEIKTIREKIIILNSSSNYYDNMKNFYEILLIGINILNKNEYVKMEKSTERKMMEEVNSELFSSLDQIHEVNEEFIKILKDFKKSGDIILKKMKESTKGVFFFTKINEIKEEIQKLKIKKEKYEQNQVKYNEAIFGITKFGIERDAAVSMADKFMLFRIYGWKKLKFEEIAKYMILFEKVESKIIDLNYVIYHEEKKKNENEGFFFINENISNNFSNLMNFDNLVFSLFKNEKNFKIFNFFNSSPVLNLFDLLLDGINNVFTMTGINHSKIAIKKRPAPK